VNRWVLWRRLKVCRALIFYIAHECDEYLFTST
jgi:hypothetical protein